MIGKLIPLLSEKAVSLCLETIKVLKPYNKFVHSVTADNGTEFADHEKISSNGLESAFYFAHLIHHGNVV